MLEAGFQATGRTYGVVIQALVRQNLIMTDMLKSGLPLPADLNEASSDDNETSLDDNGPIEPPQPEEMETVFDTLRADPRIQIQGTHTGHRSSSATAPEFRIWTRPPKFGKPAWQAPARIRSHSRRF